MSKAEQLRAQAQEAVRRAGASRSLRAAVVERKRAHALEHLAATEDWLDGRSKPHD